MKPVIIKIMATIGISLMVLALFLFY